MAEVVLPDGNIARIPDFAMEKTQNDMKQLLSALVGADEKALKVYENIFKNAKEQTKQSKDDAKELQDLTKDGNKALEEVADAAKKGKIFTGDNVLKGVGKVDSWLTKSFLGLGGAAITAAGFLASGVKGLGDELLGLQQLGVGFTDATGSAENLIADLGYLGMTAGQASNLMGDFAGVVQVMGKTGFGEIQKTFANLSNNGNDFGLSIAESAEILSEDLALRKRLGMMENINAAKAAAESASLYKQQMKAAQMLGKSIQEIRKESDNLVESNIQAQLAINQLGPEAIGSFRSFATELSGMNIDQNLADGIMTAMAEPVAFASAGGQELFAALSASGKEGMKLIKEIEEVNALKVSDPEEFNRRVKEMGPKIGQALSKMSKDPNVAKSQAELISAGAVGADMMGKIAVSGMSANSALIAAANAADSVQSPLAKGAQAFDASMNTLSGSLSGMSTDLFGAFGEPMAAFADAITKETIKRNEAGEILDKTGKPLVALKDIVDENGKVLIKQGEAIKDVNDLTDEQRKEMDTSASVMGAFKDAMEVVRKTVMKSFGLVGDSTEGLADKIRAYLVPAIEGFAAWFQGGGWESIKNAFKLVGGILSGFGEALGFVKYLVTDKLIPAIQYLADMFGFGGDKVDEDGKEIPTDFAKLGKTIGLTVVGLLALTKTFKLTAGAVSLVKGMFGRFAGGGAAGAASAAAGVGGGPGGAAASGAVAKQGASFGKTIAKTATYIGVAIKNLGIGLGKALAGIAEGLAQGVAAVGKGLGTALGGILKGLAGGLAAFANPAILLGAGILGGAITLIGAGIAGAAWIMGEALPTFAEGLESFADIDGDNLVNVAKGIGAIGLAMAAMGAGGVAGSVGTAVSNVVDGIAGFFGADDPLDKINEFAAYEFDVAKVMENAGAVQAFGEAMLTLAASTSADGLINIRGIDHNISALNRLTVLFAKFANLPVPENIEAIVATAEAIDKVAPGSTADYLAIDKSAPAYQKLTATYKRKNATNQPDVMSVPYNSNTINTAATNTQPAAIQDQAKASGNQALGPSGTETSSTTNELDVLHRMEQHLAAIVGNSNKQVKGLKKLDQSVQDDF